VVLGAAPAGATDATAGTYVSLDRAHRVLDTRLGAGHDVHPEIAGHAGLPDHGIGAVVGTLTAYSPTADGHLVAYPGHRPATASLYFGKGRTAGSTVVVALNSGRLHLADVGRSGHVRVALDVTGYYRSGTASTPGAFHAIAPARVVDTRHGTAGNRHGALHHGHGFTAHVAGKRGVPKQSVGAVAVSIHVLDPTSTGTLTVSAPDVPQPNRPAVHFRAEHETSTFAVVALGSGSGIRIFDAAHSGTVQVLVDVLGYYTYGTAAQAGAYEPLPSAARVAHGSLGGGATKSVPVAGRGGLPRTHVADAVVEITFAGRQTTSNVVIAPASHAGAIRVHNASRHRVDFGVDVVGYVPGSTITAPPAFVGRYVRNLTSSDDIGNTKAMNAEGQRDAAAGSKLVLLDVGAELNDRTGVQLSATHVRLSWMQLVNAIDAYLTGYAGAESAPGTIAIATNNDGDWREYPATPRGRDWANKVIDRLTVPDGVHVAGSADIESGFVSTRAQAQTWEDAYLAATAEPLYYVGSADGCPVTFGVTNATCRFGWTERQYYALAHHGTRIRVLPQVYTPGNAVQWANIDATGGNGLIFAGALTERAAAPALSQHPAQGWAALYRALSAHTDVPHVPAVVDLQSDD
jgi:hypothetical protein